MSEKTTPNDPLDDLVAKCEALRTTLEAVAMDVADARKSMAVLNGIARGVLPDDQLHAEVEIQGRTLDGYRGHEPYLERRREEVWRQACALTPEIAAALEHLARPLTIDGTDFGALAEDLRSAEAAARAAIANMEWFPSKHYDRYNIPGDTLRQAAQNGRVRKRKGNGSHNEYADIDVRRCWPERFIVSGPRDSA